MNRGVSLSLLMALVCLPGLGVAVAQDNEDLYDMALEELMEVELTGAAVRDLGLDKKPQTANPFKQSARDLPLSIDVMSRQTMRARGLKSVTEAADQLVGVISGESPAEPSSFSIRGFTRDSVTILRDGIKLGPATMTMRPHNTFNLQQIDIVRGAASLQYGHGTASGFINMVTRKAKLGHPGGVELFAAASSHNSYEWGVGASTDWGKHSAVRIDINQSASAGWVDQTDSKSRNITASAVWHPTPSIDVLVSMDHLKDDLPAYWGTPLVPAAAAQNPLNGIVKTDDGRVLDSRLRTINYNVADSRSDSSQLWRRLKTTWRVSQDVELENTLYHFKADRAWQNAESYVYDSPTNTIQRDRFFVFHDHRFVGNQLSLILNNSINAMPFDVKATLDYNHTDFLRSRGFPDGDNVAVLQPEPGLFGPLDKRASPTVIESWSLNIESRLQWSERWQLLAGVRADNTNLIRDNFDVQGAFIEPDSFARTFNPLSWHIAGHYQLSDNSSAYLHYSTAHDPVGSNILLVNANENFDFADIRQYELGYKATVPQYKLEWTAAYFDIRRSNILLLTSHDTVGNAGVQIGRGVELAASAQLSPQLRVGGNIAYNHARYRDFIDPDFGVNASGNQPPNVPKVVANAWFSRSETTEWQLEVGGGIRYVGDRFTNFQNTATLSDYWLVNLFAARKFGDVRVALNIRNAFNQDYAPWADIFYANQIGIADRRSVELNFQLLY